MATPFTFGCAICADRFDIHKTVCAIRCGHVYHSICLRQWLMSQNQQQVPTTCPKCRASVDGHDIHRLFLHQVDDDLNSDDNSNTVSETESESITDAIVVPNDDTVPTVTTIEDEANQSMEELIQSILDRRRRLGYRRNMGFLSAVDRRLDEISNEVQEMDDTVDDLDDTVDALVSDDDIMFMHNERFQYNF